MLRKDGMDPAPKTEYQFGEEKRQEQWTMWNIIIIPFLGTALGAASVFLLKKEMGRKTNVIKLR